MKRRGKKHSKEGRKAQCQSPMIPCMVIALLWKAKASLRNFNVKQKQKTFRGQWSKITSQSLASPACFLLTIPLHSLAPALLHVHVCVCVCTHIGLNKPGDAGLVTHLTAIQSCLTLPLLLQALQCPTTTHFPCWCFWLKPMVLNMGGGGGGESRGLLFLLMVGVGVCSPILVVTGDALVLL